MADQDAVKQTASPKKLASSRPTTLDIYRYICNDCNDW
jgi:hypothetical protein